MAIDNSLYDSLENTYFKIKDYLESTKLGPEHSQMIVKHEELGELLERLDIEAIEEQSKDIHALHAKLSSIKEVSDSVADTLQDACDTQTISETLPNKLNTIFTEINPLVV